ncbi:GNAT family N-acetyltransferase [Collimonas pratensis]|uniref:Acetyltransferase family protein n=1 Tax=Collimonas pratensis TaxID=279113 RepID=A0A127Q4Y4_9BURK|nr:GNAT family N-acetyltransferase [Collimonas pratensis]AMP05083.1 acetyltransferase family protein [Collimonas pratensis]
MITLELSDKVNELEQIVALQRLNRLDAVTADVRATEGFVTMEYTVRELQLMRGEYRHVVAKCDGAVIAYALVMLKDCRASFPFLDTMFRDAETAVFKGMQLREKSYFFMGQICVGQAFRGQGIFRKLYQMLCMQMRADFDCVVTEVSVHNARSMRAHQRVGFKEIVNEHADATEWRVIVWDWS